MFIMPSMRAFKSAFIRQFIAVGQSGRTQTSPDGTTWTSRTTSNTATLRTITYTGSRYVIGGDTSGTGVIQTSTDGITWTNRTLADTSVSSLNTVTSGNSIVIAGATKTPTTGKIQYSTDDGVTWANAASTPANTVLGSTYGNGIFVAVGRAGTIQTSTDGSNWTTRTTANTEDMFAVTYGNGLFVAVGRNGAIQTSTNSIDWTSVASNPARNFELYAVTYGNGLYVTAGRSASFIYTSTDGATWTQRTNTSGDYVNGLTYSNTLNLYVAVGINGLIQTSANGTSWANAVSANTNNDLEAVIFYNG